MRVRVYTKLGKLLHEFRKVDEIKELESCYEIVFEDDAPWTRVYGKEHVIIIKY